MIVFYVKKFIRFMLQIPRGVYANLKVCYLFSMRWIFFTPERAEFSTSTLLNGARVVVPRRPLEQISVPGQFNAKNTEKLDLLGSLFKDSYI
jgi:hypothetical protein